MQKTIMFMVTIILLSNIVFAVEPTQQYNKIFLDPMYRENMEEDVSYNYTLIVNPPDRISDVLSAIVTFQVWHNPTVRYSLWVDGQTCNTETFLVHTSYANAGEGTIYFDCSNVITSAGEYTLTLQADDDLGTSTAWIDIVYMNQPDGEMDVFGTEYRQEETATIFLQLKDSQGFPVLDGSCYMNMYTPLTLNGTHDTYLSNAPMMYLEGSPGLHYYDIQTLPSQSGVYMLSASCSYSTGEQFVYASDGTDSNYPNRTEITGTFSSSPIVLNSYTDFLYTKCVATGGATKTCVAYYDYDTSLKVTNYSDITELGLFFMGEASTDAEISFRVYNWTGSSWIDLPNILTYSGLAVAEPTGLNDFVSNSIPINDTIEPSTGIIRLETTSSAGTVFDEYINWLNIDLISAYGNVQELRGSGEIHINDWFYNYTGLIAEANWNYHTKSLNNPVNITQESIDEIKLNVWNNTNRTTTGQEQLWIGGTEYSPDEETGKVIVRLVDNTDTPVDDADCILRVAYPNNTISFEQNMTHINGTEMGGLYVADFTLPNQPGVYPYGVDCLVTGGASPKNYYLLDTFHIFGANQTKQAETIWNYPDRELTYYPTVTLNTSALNITTTVNNTAIAEEVWSWNSIGDRLIEWLDETINAVISHVTI